MNAQNTCPQAHRVLHPGNHVTLPLALPGRLKEHTREVYSALGIETDRIVVDNREYTVPSEHIAAAKAAIEVRESIPLSGRRVRKEIASIAVPEYQKRVSPNVALIYLFERWRLKPGEQVTAPSVKAITAGFGNTLQVGVPVAAGVFGEQGLAIHIAVVSLHALTILTLLTALVELDVARGRSSRSFRSTLAQTVRNTVIHPVVLPVLAGLAWNATGWAIPTVFDEVLQNLGTAVVPLCLTLIGMSLAYYGWPKSWRGLSGLVSAKLLLIPAVVLGIAHWGLGLNGLPLAVIVMVAALPTGSNALIFAQRYRTMEPEVTAATVLSMVLYVATAPVWLALLAWISPW